jgi:hypothetical protein
MVVGGCGSGGIVGRTWVVEMLFDNGNGISDARSRMN